jgi:hypothetical protein
MQILRQHKNGYKLYAWARTQECLDAYRIKYEDRVRHFDRQKTRGQYHRNTHPITTTDHRSALTSQVQPKTRYPLGCLGVTVFS